jgi:hypothetical protein
MKHIQNSQSERTATRSPGATSSCRRYSIPMLIMLGLLFTFASVGHTFGSRSRAAGVSAPPFVRSSAIAKAAGSIAAAMPLSTCPPPTITGDIGQGSADYPGTSGVQTGRLSQNGVDSTCASPKTCPGVVAGSSFAFDAYEFANETDAAVCGTFTFPTSCGVNQAVHPVAYLGAFDPGNICTNYLGDIGHSINAGESGSFSVNAPAHSVVVLVVHEVGTAPDCSGYKFSVSGLTCPGTAECPPATAINGVLGSGSADYPATTGQQTGRITNGLGNITCGSSNPCSLNTPTGARTFDAYTFLNPGASTACVTVNFVMTGCSLAASMQFSARLGSFDPANPCTNYVGDGGAGFSGEIDNTFSFNVPAGQHFVVVVNENDPAGAVGCAYSLTISGVTCVPSAGCTLTCPSNITRSNDPNQCGAVVTYSAPTSSGQCGAITCSPASSSFFAVGTTTVTCSDGNSSATCSFTVTVNDTQPPTITCPSNVTGTTAQNVCSSALCQVIHYAAPVAADNCTVSTVVCSPPSGSCLALGTSTVTCTATDSSNNSATCSFTVTVFDVCLQDDSNSSTTLLFNSLTGDYRFCCGGTVFTGKGTVSKRGCTISLQHNPGDRRLAASIDKSIFRGSASLQSPPGVSKCTIIDRDTRNNVCLCQ